MRRLPLQFFVLVLILLSLLPAAKPAHANVDLAYFEVETSAARPTELVVQWGTETETDTAGFRIKRSTTADVAQAQVIHTAQAQGSSISGHDYEYVDTGLTTGQVYHYWLVELTTGGQEEVLRDVSATPGGATATATPTTPPPTATPTPQPPTPTTQPTTVAPTATRSVAAAAANTAAPNATPLATATPQPPAISTVAPANTNAPGVTPAPANTDSTAAPLAAPAPSGDVAAQEQETAAASGVERSESQDAPTQDPALATGETAPAGEQAGADPTLEATATATPQSVAQAPQPPLDSAQTQLVRPTATPRPDDTADATGNTNSLLLVIGGGSLCGAALLVLAVLFVWRRR